VRGPGAVAIIAVSAMAATTWLLTQPSHSEWEPPASPLQMSESLFQDEFARQWVQLPTEQAKEICSLYYIDRARMIPLIKQDFEGITSMSTDINWYRKAIDYACDYSL